MDCTYVPTVTVTVHNKYKLDMGSKIHSERDQINKGNRVYCCYKVRLCCISRVAYYVSLCLRAWCISKQGGVYEI